MPLSPIQIRAAFLLAKKLGRLLILPRILCGLDRFWAPHNGTIPGSDTALPIDPCPADHVIDLEHIGRVKPVESLLREYSFLDNPRLPSQVASSIRSLPPPQSLGPESVAALATLPEKVLNFSYMPDLFSTLAPEEQLETQGWMKTWTSIWCCSIPLPKKAGRCPRLRTKPRSSPRATKLVRAFGGQPTPFARYALLRPFGQTYAAGARADERSNDRMIERTRENTQVTSGTICSGTSCRG